MNRLFRSVFIAVAAVVVCCGSVMFSAATDPVRGDANGDGSVNSKDVLMLRQYVAGMSVELKPGADVNGDDAVNNKDVLWLREQIAGIVRIRYSTKMAEDGREYLLKNGVPCTETGVFSVQGQQRYFLSGVFTASSGLISCNGTWYQLQDGVLSDVTGLVDDGTDWIYLKNGIFTASTLLLRHDGQACYIQDGVWQAEYVGVVTIGDTVYPVVNGVLSDTTGLVQDGTTSVQLKNGKTGVVVSWDAVSGAKSYRIYRKTSGNDWKNLCATTDVSYTDTTVSSGENYCYTVQGVDGDGILSPAVIEGICYIGAPVLRHADAADNGITVTWSAVKGASLYRVFYKTDNGWKKLGDTTATEFLDKTVKIGQSRYYTVRCVSADGVTYSSDFYAEGISGKRLAAPTLSLADKAAAVTVSWDAVTGAEAYRVYRKTENGSWTTLSDVTACSYTDKTVSSGTTYRYAVRCVNRDGTQWQSSFQTTSIRFIAAPMIQHTHAVTDGIEVSWNAVAGVSAYRLYYKTSDGWKKLVDTTATTYLDKTVGEGAGRTYTVRCITKDGKLYLSGFYSGTTGWRLMPPTVSYYAENTKLKLSWAAVEHAGKYRVYRYQNGGWVKLGDTANTQYTMAVPAGERVMIAVRCLSADGKSFYSSYNPVMGQLTAYTYRSVSRTMAGCGSFSKTGGISFAQQQGIERYLNAYYSAIGSFTDNTAGVFCSQKTVDREKAIWNNVNTIRKQAFEDLSMKRYRFSASVSKVTKVSDSCVKVTAWVNCNQQFRDIPVLSQVYKNENFFTLKKSSDGNWLVSEHDADCSPFYHFQYDEKTKTDKQLSTALAALKARQATWDAATAKPGKTVKCDHPYNRTAALNYLLQWIEKRNPQWGVYDPYGGNCMNMTSQVLTAGGMRQNGQWYWNSQWDCSSSWINVGSFADYAASATHRQLCCTTTANYYTGDVGDLVLIGISEPRNHATVISGLVKNDKGQTIDYLLSCNTSDLKNFPASAYHYTNQHLIRIYGYDN